MPRRTASSKLCLIGATLMAAGVLGSAGALARCAWPVGKAELWDCNPNKAEYDDCVRLREADAKEVFYVLWPDNQTRWWYLKNVDNRSELGWIRFGGVKIAECPLNARQTKRKR
jgi:hypothetical protein